MLRHYPTRYNTASIPVSTQLACHVSSNRMIVRRAVRLASHPACAFQGFKRWHDDRLNAVQSCTVRVRIGDNIQARCFSSSLGFRWRRQRCGDNLSPIWPWTNQPSASCGRPGRHTPSNSPWLYTDGLASSSGTRFRAIGGIIIRTHSTESGGMNLQLLMHSIVIDDLFDEQFIRMHFQLARLSRIVIELQQNTALHYSSERIF